MRTSPLLLALFVALTSVACDSAGFKRGYMALDSEGARARRLYTDSEGIFCVVEMASGREDVTVKAELHAQAFYVPPDGHAEEASVFIAAEEEAPGAGEELTVSFEWVRDADEPYPAGVYECRLFLEDELEGDAPVRGALSGVSGGTCRTGSPATASCCRMLDARGLSRGGSAPAATGFGDADASRSVGRGDARPFGRDGVRAGRERLGGDGPTRYLLRTLDRVPAVPSRRARVVEFVPGAAGAAEASGGGASGEGGDD